MVAETSLHKFLSLFASCGLLLLFFRLVSNLKHNVIVLQASQALDGLAFLLLFHYTVNYFVLCWSLKKTLLYFLPHNQWDTSGKFNLLPWLLYGALCANHPFVGLDLLGGVSYVVRSAMTVVGTFVSAFLFSFYQDYSGSADHHCLIFIPTFVLPWVLALRVVFPFSMFVKNGQLCVPYPRNLRKLLAKPVQMRKSNAVKINQVLMLDELRSKRMVRERYIELGALLQICLPDYKEIEQWCKQHRRLQNQPRTDLLHPRQSADLVNWTVQHNWNQMKKFLRLQALVNQQRKLCALDFVFSYRRDQLSKACEQVFTPLPYGTYTFGDDAVTVYKTPLQVQRMRDLADLTVNRQKLRDWLDESDYGTDDTTPPPPYTAETVVTDDTQAWTVYDVASKHVCSVDALKFVERPLTVAEKRRMRRRPIPEESIPYTELYRSTFKFVHHVLVNTPYGHQWKMMPTEKAECPTGLGIIASRLLCSGDVEENPGPVSTVRALTLASMQCGTLVLKGSDPIVEHQKYLLQFVHTELKYILCTCGECDTCQIPRPQMDYVMGRFTNKMMDNLQPQIQDFKMIKEKVHQAVEKVGETVSSAQQMLMLAKLLLIIVGGIYCVRNFMSYDLMDNILTTFGMLGLLGGAYKIGLLEDLRSQMTRSVPHMGADANSGRTVWSLLTVAIGAVFCVDYRQFRSEKFFQMFTRFSGISQGIQEVFESSMVFSQHLVNFVLSDCLGYEKIRFLESGHEKVDNWYRACCAMALTKENNREVRQTLLDLKDQGRHLDMSLNVEKRRRLAFIIKDGLKMLKERMEEGSLQFMDSGSEPFARARPVVIHFWGASGAGKSTLTSLFAAEFCARTVSPFRFHELRSPKDLRFSKPKSSQYWEGYTNQPVIDWSEFMQSRDAPGGDTLMEAQTFLDLVSTEPMAADQAALEKKGNVYLKPKMVLCTSNMNLVTSDAIKDINALRRRIDFNVHVTVKPEYGVYNAKEKRWYIDREKSTGINMNIYKFQLTNSSSGEFANTTTWDELMEAVTARYWTYVEDQFQTSDLVSQRMRGLMKDKRCQAHGKDPLSELEKKYHPNAMVSVQKYLREHNLLSATEVFMKHLVPYKEGETLEEFYDKQDHDIFRNFAEQTPEIVKAKIAKMRSDIDMEMMEIAQEVEPDNRTKYTWFGFAGVVLAALGAFFAAIKVLFKEPETSAHSYPSNDPRLPKSKAPAQKPRLDGNAAAVAHAAALGVIDENAFTLGSKLKNRSMYKVFLESVDGHFEAEIGHAFGYKTNQFLMNNHYKQCFQNYMAPPWNHTHCVFRSTRELPKGEKPEDIMVPLSQIMRTWMEVSGCGDYATFALDEFKTRGNPDVSNQWIREKYARLGPLTVALVLDPRAFKASSADYHAKGWHYASPFANGQDFHTNRCMNYSVISNAGECGIPVVAVNSAIVPGKLVGLHGGGRQKISETMTLEGSCEIITQELFDAHLSKFEPFLERLETQPHAVTAASLEKLGIKVLQRAAKAVSAPAFTKLRKSKLYDAKYVHTAPAKLKPFRTGDGVSIDPMEKAVANLAPRPKKLNNAEFKRAIREVVSWTKHRRPTLLTFEQAVAGDALLGVEPLDRSTSCGYPMNQEPGVDGKRHIFGREGEFEFTSERCKLLKQECAHLLALLNASGTTIEELRSMVIFQDCLKDERRSFEKTMSGTTRLFNASPLAFTIVMRQLFGSFFGEMYFQRIQNCSGVGINPSSPEWDLLCEWLMPDVKVWKLLAGDHRKFDISQDGEAIQDIAVVVGETYHDEYELARNRCGYLLGHSTHICGDVIYGVDQSLPSGLFATSWFNVIYNLSLLQTVWWRETDNTAYELVHMLKHFRPNAYGDDLIAGADDVGQQIMAGSTIAKHLLEMGHQITNDQKTGPPEYTDISHVTYLKRSFRYDEKFKQWVGALDKDVIKEIPCWYRVGPEAELTKRTNVDVSLLEASLHGEVFFLDWYKEIAPKSVEAYGYTPRYRDWLTTIKSVLVEKFPVTGNPTWAQMTMAHATQPDNVAQKIANTEMVSGGGMAEDCDELGGTVTQENMTFLDSECTVSERVPMPAPRLYHGTASDDTYLSIVKVLERPWFNQTFVYATTNNVRDVLADISPIGHDLFNNTMLSNKLEGVMGITADIHVRVSWNASRVQSGVLALIANPGNLGARYTALARQLITLTQLPHVMCNIAMKSSMEMELPFWHVMEFYQLSGCPTTDVGWDKTDFKLVVVTVPRVGTGETTIAGTIYCWLSNIKLIGSAPTAAWQAQSGRPNNIARKTAAEPTLVSALKSTVVSTIKGIPIIGQAAGAASWFARATSDVLSSFGFSNPRNATSNTWVSPQPLKSFTNADGHDDAVVLAASNANKVSSANPAAYTALDEMSFDYVLSTWTYWTTFTMQDTDTANSTIHFQILNTPSGFQTSATVSGQTLVYFHPAAYVAQFFQYARLEYEVKFIFAKTMFQTFRSEWVCAPRSTQANPAAITATDTQYMQRVLFDGVDTDELTVELPWLSAQPMMPIGVSNTYGALRCVNPLKASAGASTTIDVVVMIRVKPGSSWACPAYSANVNGYGPAVAQAGQPSNVAMLPQTSPGDHCDVLQHIGGECIKSFRTLLKMVDRYLPSSLVAASTSDYTGSVSTNANQFHLLPVLAETLFINGSNVVVKSQTATTRWSRILAMYAFTKGGVTLVFSCGGSSQDQTFQLPAPLGITPARGKVYQGPSIPHSPHAIFPATSNNSGAVTVPYYNHLLANPVIYTYKTAPGTDAIVNGANLVNTSTPLVAVYQTGAGLQQSGGTVTPMVWRRAADDFSCMWFIGCPPCIATPATQETMIMNQSVTIL